MAALPVTRLTLFKHGIAHVEREGALGGEELTLTFPLAAMDDVLKSLVVLDRAGGQVLGIDVDSPDDRAASAARDRLPLSSEQSVLDLLRGLRGHDVVVQTEHGSAAGLLLGVDVEDEHPLKRAKVSLVTAAGQVRTFALDDVAGVHLGESARSDLALVLRAARRDEQQRAATVRLTPGEHDLSVAYVVPAAAWRVSYRLLLAGEGTEALLQAWGVLDNPLDEDLSTVSVTLVAGMPVSFRYRLYEGHVPDRPELADDERVFGIPELAGGPKRALRRELATPSAPMVFAMASAPPTVADSLDELEASLAPAAEGEERGALFAYHVPEPVSVGRGQSALVPLVSERVPAERLLLFRAGASTPHPTAAARLRNASALTLERGPATVFVAGEYAGEAVVPFTTAGAEALVAHAAELGVRVTERSWADRRLVRVAIEGSYLLVEEHLLDHRRYDLTSTLVEPVTVTVAQPLDPQATLASASPAEQHAGEGRWRVEVPPDGTATLEVVERRTTTRHEDIEDVDEERLRAWREGKVIDGPSSDVLARAVALRREIERFEARRDEHGRRRTDLLERQKRIAGALEPLGATGDEAGLRSRYVASLQAVEDEIEQLDRADADVAVQREQLEAEILDLLRHGLA